MEDFDIVEFIIDWFILVIWFFVLRIIFFKSVVFGNYNLKYNCLNSVVFFL